MLTLGIRTYEKDCYDSKDENGFHLKKILTRELFLKI